MTDVTHILSRTVQGDAEAADRLLPLVYDELRRLATQKMAREAPGQTLQPTALVHEAYVRLVDTETAQHWESRGHFFAAASEAMRRILVEKARERKSIKRGGDRRRVNLDECQPATWDGSDQMLAVNEVLGRFELEHPRKAQVVKFRYFAGFSIRQIADLLGVSASTVDNDWAYARAWFKLALQATDQAD